MSLEASYKYLQLWQDNQIMGDDGPPALGPRLGHVRGAGLGFSAGFGFRVPMTREVREHGFQRGLQKGKMGRRIMRVNLNGL